MSNWLIRNTKEYIRRCSPSGMSDRFGASFVDAGGNAESNAIAIYQPDLSSVTGYASKYWVITGDVVSLMSQAEMDAIDLAEAESEKDSLSGNLDRAIKAILLALNDGSFVPGSNYTNAQLKAIIRSKL